MCAATMVCSPGPGPTCDSPEAVSVGWFSGDGILGRRLHGPLEPDGSVLSNEQGLNESSELGEYPRTEVRT